MPDGAQAEPSAPAPPRRRRFKWRAWLRALHRDFGYVAVGLTLIYALSGLAVNHIADWDPSFVNFEREFTVPTPLPDDDAAAAAVVLQHAGIDETATDIYRVTDALLEITLEQRTLHVNLPDGEVFEEGQRPRPFLRIANWLHLNRGKKAWTWFADAYAVALVFLATSGMFMIAGKKGLWGRGAVLVGLGIGIPVAYLVYFGSP